MGKILLSFGILFVVTGLFMILVSRLPFFGRLPGDIVIKRDGFTFYFPIVTSILMSIILSIIINIISRR